MTAYSRNAQSLISRMSETKNEDPLTRKDFELFHDLGFKLFDREYLDAINLFSSLLGTSEADRWNIWRVDTK